MNILPISAFSDNYIWALIDEKEAIFDCVDPGDAAPVVQFAKLHHLRLRSILLTHHHNDHIGGVLQLKQHYPDCPVYGPVDPRIPEITHSVNKGQTINIGSLNFQILSNPGHTSTHISYYELQEKWLFCGDTLFSAGCGRVFDGTIEQLHDSLLLFKQLPPETLVFCAHEYTLQNLFFAQSVEPDNEAIKRYIDRIKTQAISCSLPSTIKQELEINPFLRTEQPAVRTYAKKNGALSLSSLEILRVLREQKNQFR